ncbi:hypothetical protein [uncultured Agrobacterium sp.]|uniref:hypothetical protein n=1 Tax=uncultured Agrobacterium sp. TaxID=157277 RepID=UPI0025E9A291|nr:hypothetical protein [uncultured Agrobacterium sp.]
MADIDKKTITKLQKLLPLLTSDQPGEVAATVAAILRTLGSSGASMHDLVAALDKPRVVRKIVYRDRIVVKEKVVYRDPEPASKQPTLDAVSATDVVQAGRLLIAEAFLRESEADFVRNMVAKAERDGDLFSMTPKQRIWFRELSVRHRDMGAMHA